MKEKDLVRLSASRIQCLDTCSMTYFLKYVLKIPDSSNSGSMRGDISHMIFEILGNKRHFEKYIDQIIKDDSIKNIPSIVRLIKKRAAIHKLDLADMVPPISKKDLEIDTFSCIDQMIIIGLKTDFIDLNGKELIKSELAFDITSAAPKFRIVGFVDRIFKEGLLTISFSDFKSSKKKFSKKELMENIQALCYLCAARRLYPEFKKRKARFIMLRFPDDPIQEVNEISEETLDGFEHYLAYISEYMADFGIDKARAKTQAPLTRFRGGGLCFSRKSGWRCGYLKSMTYYHLVDKNGKVIKSVKEGEIREEKEDCLWEKKEFGGCPMWEGAKELDDL